MSKKLIFFIFIVGLWGCAYKLEQKHPFKWAVIDKSKITYSAIYETFQKNNPYPKELGSQEESRRDVELAQKQISQIESDEREKCINSNKFDEKKVPSKKVDTDTIVLPSGDQLYMTSSNGKITIMTNRSTLVGEPPELANNQAYQGCILKIQKDPLISDLEEKISKLHDLNLARSRHDEETRKKFNTFIDKTIQRYAEENNYSIIIDSQREIIYSADKVWLTVTDDLIDYISKSQANTKTVKSE